MFGIHRLHFPLGRSIVEPRTDVKRGETIKGPVQRLPLAGEVVVGIFHGCVSVAAAPVLVQVALVFAFFRVAVGAEEEPGVGGWVG